MLQSSNTLFALLGMKETARFIGFLIQEAQRPRINYDYFNRTFKNLQIVADTEFGKKDPYKKRCVAYLSKKVAGSMQENFASVRDILNASDFTTLLWTRENAYRLSRVLTRMLIDSAKSEEEKLIGLSYSYANMVEGTYKSSVQECYMWEKLSRRETIITACIIKKDVGNVLDFYTQVKEDRTIFEGYDSVVRNAVAHSTMFYDKPSKKMKYVDKKSAREKIYSFEELVLLYQKVRSVYELVLIRNLVLDVYDVSTHILSK